MYKLIICLTAIFGVGYYVGTMITTKKLQTEAIKNGVGEMIVIDYSGNTRFMFVTPNCGPH